MTGFIMIELYPMFTEEVFVLENSIVHDFYSLYHQDFQSHFFPFHEYFHEYTAWHNLKRSVKSLKKIFSPFHECFHE